MKGKLGRSRERSISVRSVLDFAVASLQEKGSVPHEVNVLQVRKTDFHVTIAKQDDVTKGRLLTFVILFLGQDLGHARSTKPRISQ